MRSQIELRVYYEDTDFSGRVYHASYLRFMERGRTEWLRERGYEHRQLQSQSDLVFAVRGLQIEYFAPALMDDWLTIETVFAGPKASPSAYLDSNPAQFAYIHFVAHAFASRADPLDSAVILSGGGAGEDSFKLYARDIMRRPINAQLVTISACNGSGARSYAGEGLVGLSWAFLRAGAHSVIGALWEATDDSTPRLMDTLYQGLEDGQTPASALRRAKLTVLHAPGKFRRPYYWAPFQIYTRQ